MVGVKKVGLYMRGSAHHAIARRMVKLCYTCRGRSGIYKRLLHSISLDSSGTQHEEGLFTTMFKVLSPMRLKGCCNVAGDYIAVRI